MTRIRQANLQGAREGALFFFISWRQDEFLLMPTISLFAQLSKSGRLASFSRFLLIVSTAFFLSGCRTDEVRGVFVARFIDDPGLFTKRITVPSQLERELRLSLATKRYLCELRLVVPIETTQGASECDRISGIDKVLCSDAREIPVGWKMTSCHSGFGKSIEGVEPPFVFGFAGNAYTAQNQLELAMQAKFLLPEEESRSPVKLPERGEEPGIWGADPWAVPNLTQ